MLLGHDLAVGVVVADPHAGLVRLRVAEGLGIGRDRALAHLDAVDDREALADRLTQALGDGDLVRRVHLGRAATHADRLDPVASDQGHRSLRGQRQHAGVGEDHHPVGRQAAQLGPAIGRVR